MAGSRHSTASISRSLKAEGETPEHIELVDIIRAFNRMLAALESRYLTTFKNRFGTYQRKVLPFGLSVGPAWFQTSKP